MSNTDKKARAMRVEKALYEWLNMTEEVEQQVCGMLDGEVFKSELVPLNSKIKQKFKHLEQLIKTY